MVNNIGAAVGDEFIEFQNGEVLELGEALGDVNEEVVKRAQIRRTIEDHLARQFELWPRGVKVLSLFFIDRVDRYRVYEPEVHGGLYALMFEEEYAGALNSKAPRRIAKAAGIGKSTWLECYEAVGALLALPQNQPNAPLYPAGGAPGSRPGALPHFGRPRYLGPPPRARSTAG